MKSSKRPCWLCGKPLVADTHAMRSGRSAIFTTVTRLIRRIRYTYAKGAMESMRGQIGGVE